MNNVTTANTLANSVINADNKMGFHEFNSKMHEALIPLIAEADMALPEGESLTPRDVAELSFHPSILALLSNIDRQLYKSEFVSAFKEQMAEMGLEGIEGAQSLIEQATAALVEFAGQDILDRSMSLLDNLGYECHAAALASFTH